MNRRGLPGRSWSRCCTRAATAVGVLDVVHHRPHIWRVRQQLGDRRLVRDEDAHLVRMTGGKGEPSDSGTAAGEHVCRADADRVDQLGQVVGLDLGCHVKGWVVHRALAQPMRVVRDDRVLVDEEVGQRTERGTGHRLTDHEQQRAGAANLAVQPTAWNVQDVRGQPMGWDFGWPSLILKLSA
jgi:hypothetical protein